MVRLILILVLLNMIYFGWNATQGPLTSNVATKSVLREQTQTIGSLQLLNEVNQVKSDEIVSNLEGEVGSTESDVIEEFSEEPSSNQFATPQCIKLFEGLEPDAVVSLENQLVDVGISVRFTTEKKVLEPHYWLIYPPLNEFSAAKALYNQLLSAGFDSFVIPSGEQRNGVSLGLFNDRQTAMGKAEEIKALNFTASEPVILRHPRSDQRQFAHIPVADGSNAVLISDQLTILELEHSDPQNCPEFTENISEAE